MIKGSDKTAGLQLPVIVQQNKKRFGNVKMFSYLYKVDSEVGRQNSLNTH